MTRSTYDIGEYCLEHQAALAAKFGKSNQYELNYAYHLDATTYAMFLRKYAEKRGVLRTNAKIKKVHQEQSNGHISQLVLDNGTIIKGDFFIDCSGFKGLLIEQTLNTGYEDWSHWLPCDTAYAVQTESVNEVLPYTRSIAHNAGWQWRIPLQHRTGNGIVFCSKYLDDDTAKNMLLDSVDGELRTEPRKIRFRTGRRLKGWNKNCVAIGLSSGFVEPLESTSIQLIMTGIFRFIRLFPFGDTMRANANEYNRQTQVEIEKVRDFIILHYHTTQRTDSPFWLHCKNMDVPETLRHRINLFKQNAHAMQIDGEIFRIDSWVQVMLGQGIQPINYHHIVDAMSEKELQQFLNSMPSSINALVDKMPSHQTFITGLNR